MKKKKEFLKKRGKRLKLIIFFLFIFFLSLFLLTNISSKNYEENTTFLVFGHVYADYDSLNLSIPLILEEHPDFVVFLGDSINKGQNKTWTKFNSIMNSVDLPLYFVPGNHDLEFPEDEEYFKKELSLSNSLFQTFILNNNTFIILNTISKDPNYFNGIISDEQFDFINSIYERDDTNKIIFMHHELFYKDDGELGGTKDSNSLWNKKIVKIIKNETLAVFSGDNGDEPYFSYVEEKIPYFGVRFSEDFVKIPPHMLKVVISNESITVEPIPIKQDLAATPYKLIEKIKKEKTFFSKIKSFFIDNFKFVFLSTGLIILLLIFIILILVKNPNNF